jgi:hypothetical protein
MILHLFTALKFAPLIVAGIFGAIPLALIALGPERLRSGRFPLAFASGVIGLAVVYVLAVSPARTHLFEQIDPSAELQEMGRFIGANTGYSDVLFSPQIEVKPKPPQRMYHAMKLVHHVENVAEMQQLLPPMESDYRVGLLLDAATDPDLLPRDFLRFAEHAENIRKSGRYRLYFISGSAFGAEMARDVAL